MKTRILKTVFFVLFDFMLICLSLWVSLLLRFEGRIEDVHVQLFEVSVIPIAIVSIMILFIFGIYSILWKYASIKEFSSIFISITTSSILTFIIMPVMGTRFPFTVSFMSWILNIFLIVGSRVSIRIVSSHKPLITSQNSNATRVMVIGVGQTGSYIIKELLNQKTNGIPVVAIDDNKTIQRLKVHGIPVVGGREQIVKACHKYSVNEIIIAIPSASQDDIKEIFDIASNTKCKIKIVPTLHEIIDGDVSLSDVKEVEIEDLLGRDVVILNTEEISGYINNEVILITGGGGSIGSELCRQIAKFKPKTLIVFDIYENNAYELQQELKLKYNNELDLHVRIGSVRDYERLEEVFEEFNPGVVFHAAAHKHVPLMEDSPKEAVKNNVFGTYNLAKCADKYKVKRFVLISTDKAVNPTNVMGATKRICEMIIQHMSKISNTKFVAVRFGNVLGSNGSVIPLFKQQIKNEKKVTVTHPDITRYFMTIPEASRLVIQAGIMAQGGEIFVLDMGKPVKILDLAKSLIKLSGFEPEVDVKIEFTGLRPGEKMYEELFLNKEGITKTKNNKIYVLNPIDGKFDLKKELNDLKLIIDSNVVGFDQILSEITNFD